MDRPAGSAKLLRAMNESAALGHLLDNGALTRNDLVTSLGPNGAESVVVERDPQGEPSVWSSKP